MSRLLVGGLEYIWEVDSVRLSLAGLRGGVELGGLCLRGVREGEAGLPIGGGGAGRGALGGSVVID